MRSYIASSVGVGGGRGLLGTLAQQPLELAGIRRQLLVAQPHRLQERDHRLGDVRLELAVALAVVAVLDRLGRHARRRPT